MNDKTKNYLKYLIGIIIIVISLVQFYRLFEAIKDYKATTKPQAIVTFKDPKILKGTSTLKVTPKVTSSDPDLVVNHYYTAKIDGKEAKVPLKTTSSTSKGNTVTYKQELDVTALVKPMLPNWEISTGVGVHEGDTYVPLGIQRNYKSNKALRVTIHFDPKEQMRPNGGEIVHVWKF